MARRPTTMRTATKLLTNLALLLATACGSDQQVVAGADGDPPPTTAPPQEPTEPGATAGELVISVERAGGFLPAGYDFRTVPQVALYGNGTVLSPGATIAIYPGPALPAVTEGQVDEGVVDRLIVAAGDAGLLDDIEESYGEPPVADAATTTVTVVANSTPHVTSVYALDDTGGPLPGITPAQQEARDRVRDFVDLVEGAALDAGSEAYVADRYRVLPLVPDEGQDPGVEPDTRDWPLPEVSLQEGVCTAVEGSQAETLRPALETASEITRWTTASGTFVLSVRPVLPHEPGCPE